MEKEKKNKLKKFLTILFYILMIVFIIKYLWGIDFSLIMGVKITWWVIFISFIIRMIGLLISPSSWEALLKRYHGKQLPKAKLYAIYAESWMGRYIPGKIGWIGGKILFATNEGVATDTAVITSFLDSILQVFSSMLVAVIFFLFSGGLLQINNQIVILMYVATCLVIICLLPPVFNRLVAFCYRILKNKKYTSDYWMNGRTLLKSTLIVSIAKLFSGTAVSVIAVSVMGPLSLNNFVYIIAVNLVSTAIGMVALFAPAGLGIKESLQIVMLSAVLNKEMAVVIVTMASIQSIIGDLVFFIGTRFLKK